ncbi:MAG: amidohydrolase [Rhizobiales bacterium]|nr:amidohydrolase [Hyphomicrobiales bacterium]NRB14883.1 amidohydrolase [Hyphomicrobiales bacterium]
MLKPSELEMLNHFRQNLHRKPEISGQEISTAKSVSEFIEQFKPDEIFPNLAGNSFAIVYNGQHEGPTLLIRCELDALPIQETGTVKYRSQYAKVAHACGHDGHMAIVASMALKLHQQRPHSGRVILVFQAAEETGKGAKPLVEALKFNKLAPKYSFALHNMPKMKKHRIGVKNGYFNCASKGMKIELIGKTSHASHPENGINPSDALCDILREVAVINADFSEYEEFTLTSISHAALGEESFGITAGYAKIMLTLRSESDGLLTKLTHRLDVFTQKISQKYNLGYDVSYDEIFEASINDEIATDLIRTACLDENADMIELSQSWRASEDFGQFASVSHSAMFLLGSGEDQPQLHNSDFNFPDEIIATGHNIFSRLIKNILGYSSNSG